MRAHEDPKEAAAQMVEKYGMEAEGMAVHAMCQAVRRGDLDAAAAWLAISDSICELLTGHDSGRLH